MRKILTLAYLLKDDKICLAMKKRGFGEGYLCGYGGKIEAGETIINAAVREIDEESSVAVAVTDLEKIAVIEFFFKDGKHLEVHTYFVNTWEGEPEETEEMRPEWFLYNDIPYEKMWADDIHWLPFALRGGKFTGRVWFKEDGKSIEKMEWTPTTF
ncbi:MAG: NUDIX domain-containing protein [Minisyncoccia bacterium]